jgi:hypothetical protein
MSDYENKLTRQILEHFELRGHWAMKTNAGYIRKNVKLAPKGTPDIIGYMPDGKFIGIEVKDLDGVVRESQEEWIRKAQENNVRTWIIRSWEQFEEVYTTYEKVYLE